MSTLFTAARPERVRRLVLVEGLGPRTRDELELRQLRSHLNHHLQLPRPPRCFSDPSEATARLRRFNPGLEPERARRLAERSLRSVPGGWSWSWDPRHRARLARPFSTDRHLQFLRGLRCPTLVIHGSESPYAPDRLDERIAAIERVEQLTLPGGHNLHFDCPEALSAGILNFLSS